MSIIDRLFGKKKKDEPVVMKTAVEEQAKKAEPLTPKLAPVIEESHRGLISRFDSAAKPRLLESI